MKNIFILTISILIAVSSNSQTIDPIFNSFKQGVVSAGGNCASIAVIKASIGTFGIYKVFNAMTYDSKTQLTTVILRSGNTVSISSSELQQAIDSANFVQKNSDVTSIKIKNYADTCFAIMCKHLQNMLHYKTFIEAINDLNDGYTTSEIGTVLGVKFQEIKPHRVKRISKLKNLVLYNTYHAIYASDGYYDEAWNANGINKISHLKFKRSGIKCGFIFCGVHGAFKIVP